MESHKRRLHGIDNRIAEREVLFLRSTTGIFLAGIAPRMAMLSDDMETLLKENKMFGYYLYLG